MDALDELRQLLPPPEPGVSSTVDWLAVEAAIGSELPRDYKQFIEKYGVGSIDDFLWVYHPTTSNQNLQLQHRTKKDLGTLRVLRKEDSDLVPYPIFPEQEGLIPWGRTATGDRLYWRTSSANPNDWIQVIKEGRGPEWAEFSGSMTELLAALLSRRYLFPIFPNDFPSPYPTFQPYADSPDP
jgi:hypothetical protein